jgi:hypothetical protein
MCVMGRMQSNKLWKGQNRATALVVRGCNRPNEQRLDWES